MKQALPWIVIVASVLLLLDFGGPIDPSASSGFGGVAEVPLEQIQSSCDDPARCVDDYLGLIDRMKEEGASGIGFLTDGVEERELLTAERANTPHGAIQELALVFEDPLVGVFDGLLHIPEGQGPWPSVVAIPGRGVAAADWPDRFGVAEDGTVLLVLQPRAWSGDAEEARLAVQLNEVGLGLDELRAYEAHLGRRYLAWWPGSAPDRVSLEVFEDVSIVADHAQTVTGFHGWSTRAGSDTLQESGGEQ